MGHVPERDHGACFLPSGVGCVSSWLPCTQISTPRRFGKTFRCVLPCALQCHRVWIVHPRVVTVVAFHVRSVSMFVAAFSIACSSETVVFSELRQSNRVQNKN